MSWTCYACPEKVALGTAYQRTSDASARCSRCGRARWLVDEMGLPARQRMMVLIEAIATYERGRAAGGAVSQDRELEKRLVELRAEAKDDYRLLRRLSNLLHWTAGALKGRPEPLVMHDWSDLPKVAAAMRRELEAARAELRSQRQGRG